MMMVLAQNFGFAAIVPMAENQPSITPKSIDVLSPEDI
jgi:hypothetical protein